MFPIILIILFVGLLVVSAKGLVIALRAKYPHTNDGLGAASILGGAVASGLLIAITAIWPTLYFGSVGEITSMEAFYHDTLSAYEHTVTATGNIEITNAESGLVDIAYQEQGVATSERLRELRDRIEWFNARLWHYERFNTFFIADGFLADLPGDLAPIRIAINGEEE